MKWLSVRYGTRFGCRFGQPHDLIKLGENPQQIWERCKLCGKTFRWNKSYKGRVANVEYLQAHVRQYAQDFGSTKRAYMKLYKPEKTTIIL
jgi:hypothetical protein